MHITVKEAAQKWNFTPRKIRELCAQGKIVGAVRDGRKWLLPAGTLKPEPKGHESIESLLASIYSKIAELSTRRALTQGEKERLNEDFAISYIYNSNAIEGNKLSLRETSMVLEGLAIAEKPLKDQLEVFGHKEAFDFMMDMVLYQMPLSEQVIKCLHNLLLACNRQYRGVYRAHQVRILGAKHQPIEPSKIAVSVTQLLETYSKSNEHITEHPIAKIARFHLEFEAIHPFIDGNGRTVRLLMNMQLLQKGYLPIEIAFEDRHTYYNAFDEYHVDDNLDAMTSLFAKYENERLNWYLSFL